MPTPQRDTIIYEAGPGKRLVLAVVFLLLAPFFVSLGPMLVQRLSHNLLEDAAGFAVFAVLFALLMGLIVFELVHSARARVAIGEKSVRLTLPRRIGALPSLRFVSRDVPYDQVRSVETRREIYGGILAPVLIRSTRLVLRDGEKLLLGAVNEHDSDPALPFPKIGAEIAARAGIAVRDAGGVHCSASKRLLGLAATADENRPLTPDELTRAGRRQRRNSWLLVAALVALVIAGIGNDALTAAQTTFADILSTSTPAPAKR